MFQKFKYVAKFSRLKKNNDLKREENVDIFHKACFDFSKADTTNYFFLVFQNLLKSVNYIIIRLVKKDDNLKCRHGNSSVTAIKNCTPFFFLRNMFRGQEKG